MHSFKRSQSRILSDLYLFLVLARMNLLWEVSLFAKGLSSFGDLLAVTDLTVPSLFLVLNAGE